VRTIRVALLGVRPKLRDILTDAFAGEQDMELLQGRFEPDAALAAIEPDAVVCEAENPLDVVFPDRLLRTIPTARVVMVAATGDHAAVYELQPLRRVMLNVSIDQLIEAIRAGLELRKLD
jgi:hypothetical protein